MAKKPTPKKLPVKKPAVKKPAPAAKARPAAKAVKKPAAKPAAKPAPKPAAKPVAKPAPKPVAPPPPAAAKPMAVVPPPAPAVAAAHAKPAGRAPNALTVNVQTSAGVAAGGNVHAANILAVVTCGGWPVTDLNQDHFTLMEHFEVPGQQSSFSNNILTFRNAGSGAYLLQTRPNSGAPWRSGHHLGQMLVSSPDDRQGQAAFKLIIR